MDKERRRRRERGRERMRPKDWGWGTALGTEEKRQVWLSFRNMRVWGSRIPPVAGRIMGPHRCLHLLQPEPLDVLSYMVKGN